MNLADQGEGELEFIDGREALKRTRSSNQKSARTLLWKTDGAWLRIRGREQTLENGDLKVPPNLQDRLLQGCIRG